MDIVFIASGGGHTGYAIAIAERLLDIYKNIEPVFIVPHNDIWSIRRIKRRIPVYKIVKVTKPLNPRESYIKAIYRLPKALFESLTRVKNQGIMICTGSNHGLFPSIIARFLYRSYIFCVEDVFRIVSASRTIRTLYKLFGAKVFLQWSEQKRLYQRNSTVVGVVYEKPIYSVRDKGYILVTTGTIGHKRLFDLLLRTNLENVVVQTGNIDPKYIKLRKPSWRVFRFDPDIDKWVANASLVITHQGVMSIMSTQAYGKPTIIVYNPDIPLAGGLIDTYIVAKKLGVIAIDPRRIEPNGLEKIIDYAMDLKPKVQPDGAKAIARILKELISLS